MKTSKIKSFDVKKPFKGQNSAFIGFENDDWGFYEYKGEPDFKIGDEVSYEIEVTKSPGGKDVHKLTLEKPTSETSPKETKTETKNTPKVSNTSVNTFKGQLVIKAMEFTMNCYIADKFGWDKIKDNFKEVLSYLTDGADECTT